MVDRIQGQGEYPPVQTGKTRRPGLISTDDYNKLAGINTSIANDANGWTLTYDANGRKKWKKRFLGLTMPAAVAVAAISASPLPVGVTDQSGVYIDITVRAPGGNGWAINAGVDGSQTSTTLTVSVGTVDGTNLSTKTSTLDLLVELNEG
jgi:hypothetical protein